MPNTTDSNIPLTDPDRLVRRETFLEQLRPVEEIVEAARGEIAQHRAACRAAEATGKVDPDQLRQAELAANGIDELIDRFGSMVGDVSGQSRALDDALEQMEQMLVGLRQQIRGVVSRLENLS